MADISGKLVEAANITINELFLAKRAAEQLHTKYPGHLWAVSIDGSFLDVRNMALSGNWGFRVSLREMYSASDWDKKIMRAGGELLERYKQRRGVIDVASILALPTNFAGRHQAAA